MILYNQFKISKPFQLYLENKKEYGISKEINQIRDINSQIVLLKCFVRKKKEINKIIGEMKDTKILREIKNS